MHYEHFFNLITSSFLFFDLFFFYYSSLFGSIRNLNLKFLTLFSLAERTILIMPTKSLQKSTYHL